jgi:hypothetical protein
VPDGSQWLASGTLYSKNMLISGKNRAVASTYFKADATAPYYWPLKTRLVFGNQIMKIRCFFASSGICRQRSFNHGAGEMETCDNQEHCHCPESAFSF